MIEELFENYKALMMHRAIWLEILEAAANANYAAVQTHHSNENVYYLVCSQMIYHAALRDFFKWGRDVVRSVN